MSSRAERNRRKSCSSAIRLTAVTVSMPLKQRSADHPLSLQLPMQRVAGGPSLVAAADLAGGFAPELPRQPPNRLRRRGFGPFHHFRTIRKQGCHFDRVLVCVHPHPGDTVRVHDRLLSYAALAPRGANPRSSVMA